MLSVALFRNLNLGQGWAPPTGAALEAPFHQAGATSVRSFQTNGTVAFDPGRRRARTVTEQVRATLAASYGYTDLCVVMRADELVALVDQLAATVSAEHMVTFFDGDESAALRGIETLGSGPGWVVTRFDQSPVNPSRDVLAAIGPRATTRTFGTVTRLCRALGLVDRTAAVAPAVVTVPGDLAAALDNAGLRGRFDAQGVGLRRSLVTWVEGAVRVETRQRRITGVVDRLRS